MRSRGLDKPPYKQSPIHLRRNETQYCPVSQRAMPPHTFRELLIYPSMVHFVHEECSTAASRRIHSELVLSQAL
jgi:hypothetical protein